MSDALSPTDQEHVGGYGYAGSPIQDGGVSSPKKRLGPSSFVKSDDEQAGLPLSMPSIDRSEDESDEEEIIEEEEIVEEEIIEEIIEYESDEFDSESSEEEDPTDGLPPPVKIPDSLKPREANEVDEPAVIESDVDEGKDAPATSDTETSEQQIRSSDGEKEAEKEPTTEVAAEDAQPSKAEPPKPAQSPRIAPEEEDSRDIGWKKPDWTKNTKLKSTGKADKMKAGNLAAPITSLPHQKNEDNIGFKKPDWTGEVKEHARSTVDPAKPITSLPHQPREDGKDLSWKKPDWTKNPVLKSTTKGEQLKQGQGDIARPIGGIKPVDN